MAKRPKTRPSTPSTRWSAGSSATATTSRYFTGVDADRRGSEILQHNVYLSVGHDEYWSGQQRANVEAARDAGVNLAFFSGNEIFWKTRWENSIDGSHTPYRTLVSYKETHANAKIDLEPNVWTGTWRDPRFSPPADGGRPENALSGQIFMVDEGTTAIQVPAADGKMRLWRNTSVASLAPGQTATLAEDTLGYEWDEDVNNGSRPAGLMDLSSTTVEVPERLLDYGSTYGPGTATHHLTLYRAGSGALVFGAGTVQWSWGLEGEHDRGESTPDPRMQQATVNLLADMGSQPGSLQEDLTPASQTTDTTPPSTTISAPLSGAHLQSGIPTTIGGTATDAVGESAGGQVAGVEVSTDGGQSWHPASGRDQWSYAWTPSAVGKATIEARAVDDSGNLESPPSQIEVEVKEPSCPCSLWDESFTAPQDADSGSVELGVKFRSDEDGLVTGIRFYKTAGNTGQHVGHLYTAAGTQLAEATFTGESASGWQTVTFDEPVPITAGATYVAAYHTPTGHYASISDYFAFSGHDSGPLHALAEGVSGENGVFKYGPSGTLFSEGQPGGFHSTNYLVDVVFEEQVGADTTPPVLNGQAPTNGAGGISTGVTVSTTFNEAMDPATITETTLQLREPGGALVPATVTYSASERRASLKPSQPLHYSTAYTATAKGGSSGVEDLAGNAMGGDSSWSFTTGSPPPPPPNSGPGGPVLVISNEASGFSTYYAEILRAEGINEFAIQDIGSVTSAVLGNYDVAILGEGSLSSGQVQMLEEWVNAGGNLIAMRPSSQLAGLLGISPTGTTLSNAYLKVDNSTAPGAGIVNQTIQFHGTADRYSTAAAETIATLYSNSSTATSSPAVTLRSVGSKGGQAASFSYDLAKSVVYTRQGNPAWAGQERDGNGPIRSDDLFFGAKSGDVQPDWVDLSKVAIPQADEQQRLLSNLIEKMNADRKPLPRFWFLPHDYKAAVVMTGDDHGNGGTIGRFEKYEEGSSPGCVGRRMAVRQVDLLHLPEHPDHRRAGSELRCQRLRDRPAHAHQLRRLGHARRTRIVLLQPAGSVLGDLPRPARTVEQPHPLHHLERLGYPTEGRAPERDPARRRLLLLAWFVGPGPAGNVHRLGHADALRRSGWLDRRCLPGSDADDRRVRTDLSLHGRHAARKRPRAQGLLRRLHGERAHGRRRIGNLRCDSGGGAGTWGADRLRASDVDLARWSQPVVVRVDQLVGQTAQLHDRSGAGRERPAGDAADELRNRAPADDRTQRGAGGDERADDQGGRIRVLRRGSRQLFGCLPRRSRSSDLERPRRDGERRHRDDHLGNQRAGQFAGRLRHRPRSPHLERKRSAARHLAHRAAVGPRAEYHLSLQGELGRRRLELHHGTRCAARAAELHDAAGRSGAERHGSRLAGQPELTCGGGIGGGGDDGAPLHRRDCSGAPVATGTAAALESGIAVSVPDNSTTALRATATSGAGASACSAPLSYVEDSGAPDTQITTEPAALVNSATANFEFTGQDPGGSGVASYECRKDGGSWGACTSPQQYAELSEGAHTFEVRAIDQAGNADTAPASYSWTVDTAAPETQITLHPQVLANSAAAKFEFTGDDPGGSGVASFQCRLDSTEEAAWGACTSPQRIHRTERGPPQLRSAGDRQRRQRRRQRRLLRLDGGHDRAPTGDRLALQDPAEGGGDQRSELARR